jgi:organic hydroperoxide reductase OsmC/OhrA
MSDHEYSIQLTWTGNQGSGTSGLRDFTRDGECTAENHPSIPLSTDPGFLGDGSRYNPEELLGAALSNCHMLSFLFLCTQAKIIVTGYEDQAVIVRTAEPGQLGKLTSARLQPKVSLEDESRRADADALHAKAHQMCLIAQTLNIPVKIDPQP